MSDEDTQRGADAGGTIPARNTAWHSPFSDPVAVNAEADHTHETPVYSSVRRIIALAASVLLLVWVAVAVYASATRGGFEGDEATAAAFGLNLYVNALVRFGIAALVAWGLWRWANRPIVRVRS
ncbi:MAG: hypothetical protein WDZ57_04375 [Demequina sp.]